jgi:hypothetical protein
VRTDASAQVLFPFVTLLSRRTPLSPSPSAHFVGIERRLERQHFQNLAVLQCPQSPNSVVLFCLAYRDWQDHLGALPWPL